MLKMMTFSSAILLVLALQCGIDAAEPAIRLDPAEGVVLETALGTFSLDRSPGLPSPRLRFAGGAEKGLTHPEVKRSTERSLLLSYTVASPGGAEIRIERDLSLKEGQGGTAFLERFKMTCSRALEEDVEVARPFSWLPAGGADGRPPAFEAAWPLKDGRAKREPLAGKASGEYRLGHAMTGPETPHLALPLVSLSSPGASLSLYADPAFSALFEIGGSPAGDRSGPSLIGSLRFAYQASRVPFREESRSFAVRIAPGGGGAEGFRESVDRFFDLLLPDVPPGPAWIHEIAMVGYDFLSDAGMGWERDARLLSEWLPPGERRRVALCLHGWYDGLGSYSFDARTGRMKDEWTAMERTRKVKFTQGELKRRLALARDLGFRVLLYFADGLAADSGLPGYRDDWAWRDEKGKKTAGWQGPDTFGLTYLRNPAHPEVYRWHLDYLRALLETCGRDIDGLVWDETFHGRSGQIALVPEPAYCDRAYFRLVGDLRKMVKEFDREKVFLASDCAGVFGWVDVPGYAMVADGTYQDTHCAPEAWSYGLFSNWRNALWSCNWGAVSDFHLTRFGVERFGVPVAISNGWGDDRGPSEWTPRERERILGLFRKRLEMKDRVRYLEEDPAKVLAAAPDRPAPGDPIPEPAPGEVNWALASRGARSSASSEERASGSYPASGAIDGIRDDKGWGGGHGWVSKAGEPLPQWIQVEFPRPREIRRLVVIAYQREGSEETAAKWGVTDYRIESWDGESGSWKTLVTEARGRAVKTRLHALTPPVRAGKLRLIVDDVAPLDGQARLLQVEAWGPGEGG